MSYKCVAKLIAFVFLLTSSALSQAPVPFVNAPLVPSAVAPGSPGLTLTVNGTGFVAGAVVKWNGSALATNFVSGSQLTAAVPAADLATPGTASVTVLNPGTPSSNVALFSITSPTSDFFYGHAPGSPMHLGQSGGFYNEPLAMATADFNGDGIPDLALAVEAGAGNPGFLQVLLGKGDGTFTPVASTPTLGLGPGSIAVGDLSGDGKVDVAITNYGSFWASGTMPDNTVTVLLGNGDGTFAVAPGSPVTVGSDPTAVVMADINGDGKLDLAVANSTDQTVNVLLGNGDGTFTLTSSTAAPNAYAIAAGDFNADGKLDLAVSNLNTLTILLGNGDGTFTPAPSPAAPSGFAIVAADFNGDGKLDLAVGYRAGLPVTILLGNGDGTFNAVPGCCGQYVDATDSWNMRSGDFNGDGKLDLALSFQSDVAGIAAFEVIMLGNGDGTFVPTDFSMLLPPRVGTPVIADFNGDGRMDLADSSDPYNYVSVLLQTPPPANLPDFSLSPVNASASVTAGGTADYQVQLSSLNGYLGTVSLTCSGAPSTVQCSLPQPLFMFDTASATFQVSLATTAPSSVGPNREQQLPPVKYNHAGLITATVGLMFAACMGIPMPKRFSGKPRLLHVVVLMMCALSISCGGGSPVSPPPPTGGTAPGTYTITVTGSSGTLQHSTTLTLVVR